MKKIYPNRKWMNYWRSKKAFAKKEGIDFTLTTEDKLHLTESFPIDGHPAHEGYHLSRLDWDKGYTIDNVEWQWHEESHDRFLDSRRIYPNSKWRVFWNGKRNNAKQSGIDFTLTLEERFQLIEEFPIEGGHPSNAGYHLGRLDHDKGYSADNVEWQWHADNTREMVSRRDNTYLMGKKLWGANEA